MESLIAICAVISGWLLNEFSGLRNIKRKQKSAISSALSVLLEVRFLLIFKEELKETYSTKFNISHSEAIKLQNEVINIFLPEQKEIQAQFNEALKIISEFDAILAYKYRYKDKISDIYKEMENLGIMTSDGQAELEKFASITKEVVIPQLEHLVIETASMLSKKQSNKVKKELEKDFQFEDMLKKHF